MQTFSNTATLAYNAGVISSNTVRGEIADVITAAKNAVSRTYGSSSTLTYIIAIVNSGTAPYNGLTVTDNLGEYAYGLGTLVPTDYIADTVHVYTNGVPVLPSAVCPGAPLVISGINVPAGGNTVIVYSVAVNGFAPLGTGAQITNTAVISGSALPENVIATETVLFANEASLSIVKTLEPQTVVANGTVTYTITIENSGSLPVTAADGATVSDLFDPVLGELSANFNGALLCAVTDYTYDAVTGAFVTADGVITVPAATYSTDAMTGIRTMTPGVSVLTVSGRIQ